MKLPSLLFGALLVWLLVAPGLAEERKLKPFSRVHVCTPFNVKIVPSSGPDVYTVTVEAEEAVRNAFRANVADSTLQLTTAKDFTAKKPIKVTVALPKAALAHVVARGTADVAVGAGFAPPVLALELVGSGEVMVDGLDAPELAVSTTGTGDVHVNGKLGNARVGISGTGTVFLSDVSGSVALQNTGTGSVWVGAASDGVQIKGSSTGTGSVYYNRGTCSVTSALDMEFDASGLAAAFLPRDFMGDEFQPCKQRGQEAVPKAEPLSWTCGLKVRGNFDCKGAGGSSSSSSASTTSVSDDEIEHKVSSFDDSKTQGQQSGEPLSCAGGQGSASAFTTDSGWACSIDCAVDRSTLSMS